MSGYPFYSVGTKIKSEKHLKRFDLPPNIFPYHFRRLQKKHEWILAELSSSECKSCCKYEQFYKNLEGFLEKNKYLSEPLNVKFVRIDIQDNFWVLPHYASDRVPFLVLYK